MALPGDVRVSVSSAPSGETARCTLLALPLLSSGLALLPAAPERVRPPSPDPRVHEELGWPFGSGGPAPASLALEAGSPHIRHTLKHLSVA